MSDSFDNTTVLVVGGGPGGATAAALLAKAGVGVLLLERDHFPRYHIGESLLASCLPTLKLSGAFDAVASCGFQIKRGAMIHWADDEWLLDWTKLVDPDAWSWQVDRATYDNVLLRNAQKQGARVVEGAVVKRILFEGSRPYAAQWSHAGDTTVHEVHFQHLIDASGRTGLLSHQHLRMRQQHQIFQNVAVWSYWEGAQLLPGSPEGAINVVSSPDGWWWHIPMSNNKFSVGLVTHKDTFTSYRALHGNLDALYKERIRSTPKIKQLTLDVGARCLSNARADRDYSYVSEKFCGPGYFLVGDAACFLDPLLSTGVHLAQYSAMIGAAAIISIEGNDISENEAYEFFEYTYRRAYTRLLVLVTRLYERYNGTDEYFWSAQRLIHEKSRQEQAIASFTDITAGMTDLHEATNLNGRILSRSLIEEAEAAQDAKARTMPGSDLHSLDVSATWGPWRSLVGSDTTAGELYLVTDPTLRVARARKAA